MTAEQGTALGLVKLRLNKLPSDHTLDDYLQTRINAAMQELARKGVRVDMQQEDDLMLAVDLAVWRYQNRDVPGAQPEWLKETIKNRWFQQRQVTQDDS